MGQVKPWQVVLIVAAIVAVGCSAYFTLGGGSPVKLVDEVLLVDITSGELWAFPTGGHKAIVTPAKNPDTGKIALFRVSKNEAGEWTVSRRDLGALTVVEGEPRALIDKKTGQVNVTSEIPKRMN